MSKDNKTQRPSSGVGLGLLGLGAGVVGTLLWSDWSQEQAKRSRAEIEHPDRTTEVLDQLQEIITSVKLALTGNNEAAYRKRIAGYLRKRHGLNVEQEPRVDGRVPDILVEGVVAIEIKLAPKKTEIDRAIGQCVDYAKLWPTILIVVDTTDSIADEIERRLDTCDCDRVILHPFIEQAAENA